MNTSGSAVAVRVGSSDGKGVVVGSGIWVDVGGGKLGCSVAFKMASSVGRVLVCTSVDSGLQAVGRVISRTNTIKKEVCFIQISIVQIMLSGSFP